MRHKFYHNYLLEICLSYDNGPTHIFCQSVYSPFIIQEQYIRTKGPLYCCRVTIGIICLIQWKLYDIFICNVIIFLCYGHLCPLIMIHHTFSVSMFIDNLSHGRQYQSALAIFIKESHIEVNASGQNVLLGQTLDHMLGTIENRCQIPLQEQKYIFCISFFSPFYGATK